jgi:hypothetical protein
MFQATLQSSYILHIFNKQENKCFNTRNNKNNKQRNEKSKQNEPIIIIIIDNDLIWPPNNRICKTSNKPYTEINGNLRYVHTLVRIFALDNSLYILLKRNFSNFQSLTLFCVALEMSHRSRFQSPCLP